MVARRFEQGRQPRVEGPERRGFLLL